MAIACPACNMPLDAAQVHELNRGLWPDGGPCPHCGTALVPARPPLLKFYAGILMEVSITALGVLREEFMLSKYIYFAGVAAGVGLIIRGHHTQHFHVAHAHPQPAPPPAAPPPPRGQA